MDIDYKTFSKCGPRPRNEDYLKVIQWSQSHRFLAVLCDGMGGHQSGDIAAKLVCEHICTYWQYNLSQTDSPAKANSACKVTMIAFNAKSRIEMGTTMAMASIKDNTILLAHCGDSRIYHIRSGKIIYRSVDHVALTNNRCPIITRAFFTGRNCYTPDVHEDNIQPGDRIFICSDGVYGNGKWSDLEDCLISENCNIKHIEQIASTHPHDNHSGILITIT